MLSASLTLALSALPANALASCYSQRSVQPNEATAEVPSTTRVWIRDLEIGWRIEADDEFQAPTLWTSDGVLVPVALSVPNKKLVVLTPVDSLVVGEEYEIRLGDATHWDEPVRFTVTSEADNDPPLAPMVSVGEVRHEREQISFPEMHEADLDVEGAEALVWLDIDAASDLDPNTFAGPVSDVFDPAIETPFVGRGCETNWKEADVGAVVAVRAATSDLSGNLSAWTEPLEVDFGCSCVAVERDGFSGSYAVLALFAFAYRRRR